MSGRGGACTCPRGVPRSGDLGPMLIPALGGNSFRQLRFSWRMDEPTTAVITAPSLPESEARELLKAVRWELLIHPFASAWADCAAAPTVLVRHRCSSCGTVRKRSA